MHTFEENIKTLQSYLKDKNLSYYIETYGCQMNVRDSESIAGILEIIGYKKALDKEHSDLILFNTCCIRDHAEKRLLGNIGALKEKKDQNPNLVIAVCGCMMQQQETSDKLYRRFPFVDFVFGTKVLDKIPEFLINTLIYQKRTHNKTSEDFTTCMPAELPEVRNSKLSAFVNIMFGCNNFCSYCIVPYVRGREISRDYHEIVREVEDAVSKGYTEITLLGQNVNSYNYQNTIFFPDLLKMVSEVNGLKRLRFMTSHPKDLSSQLIDVMAAYPNICHHVHLPVQSGSNRILKLMNRKYTREHYLDVVRELRTKIPDVELTTDIIVGFPDETDEDFQDTLSLVNEVGFSSAFTFKYSPRNGTVAAKMENQIPESIKNQRLQELNALQETKSIENNEKYVGRTGEILVEGIDEKGLTIFGKFQNFKMVYLDGKDSDIGSYINVKVDRVYKKSLFGHRIGG